MGQIKIAILTTIVFAFATASCQKIEPGKNKILFQQNEKDVVDALHRMEFLMNKFPKTYMVNCVVDNDGYLYLSNQKIAPLKGAVNNPKVRKDMVFEKFKPIEIDEFFSVLALLMKNGVDGVYREPLIQKFLFSYNSRNVQHSSENRDIMIVSQPSDTSNHSFKNHFKVLDIKGDIVLTSLKNRKEWK